MVDVMLTRQCNVLTFLRLKKNDNFQTKKSDIFFYFLLIGCRSGATEKIIYHFSTFYFFLEHEFTLEILYKTERMESKHSTKLTNEASLMNN